MGTVRNTLGLELRLARVVRGVTQAQIAAEMGVSPRRVATIELTLRPGPNAVARYMAALNKLAPPLGEGR
jgi:transcriptional regulator with XRE-family HTH domain